MYCQQFDDAKNLVNFFCEVCGRTNQTSISMVLFTKVVILYLSISFDCEIQ